MVINLGRRKVISQSIELLNLFLYTVGVSKIGQCLYAACQIKKCKRFPIKWFSFKWKYLIQMSFEICCWEPKKGAVRSFSSIEAFKKKLAYKQRSTSQGTGGRTAPPRSGAPSCCTCPRGGRHNRGWSETSNIRRSWKKNSRMNFSSLYFSPWNEKQSFLDQTSIDLVSSKRPNRISGQLETSGKSEKLGLVSNKSNSSTRSKNC